MFGGYVIAFGLVLAAELTDTLTLLVKSEPTIYPYLSMCAK